MDAIDSSDLVSWHRRTVLLTMAPRCPLVWPPKLGTPDGIDLAIGNCTPLCDIDRSGDTSGKRVPIHIDAPRRTLPWHSNKTALRLAIHPCKTIVCCKLA